MGYLPVQIRRLYSVAVHQAEGSHSSSSEVGGSRASESAKSNDQDFGVFQMQLAMESDFRHDHLPAVSLVLLTFEWPSASRLRKRS